jgi:hypothetical protein
MGSPGIGVAGQRRRSDSSRYADRSTTAAREEQAVRGALEGRTPGARALADDYCTHDRLVCAYCGTSMYQGKHRLED